MESSGQKTKRFYAIFISLIIVIFISVIIFFSTIFRVNTKSKSEEKVNSQRKYHIVVTGSYENELFLKQVYEGAKEISANYDAVVEFYVPSSQAENVSFQKLFDYASFVNADGVIAYIDNPEFNCVLSDKIDGRQIPLVTTGVYVPSLNQISFIGNNWWELGKKIANEVVELLHYDGNLYVISDETSSSTNYSNLTSSLYESLHKYPKINVETIKKITNDIIFSDKKNINNLVLCLTEESIIKTAQITKELRQSDDRNYMIIGFGSNETCLYYLENGIMEELISLDQKKIGEAALNQIFEYESKGYANSYISAEIKITRASDK